LGGADLGSSDAAQLIVGVGASQLALQKRAYMGPASSDSKTPRIAPAWPGHFYIWTNNTRRMLEKCRALQKLMGEKDDEEGSIVQETHHLTSDDSCDALELQCPFGLNRFAVNQAPGPLAKKMLKLTGIESEAGHAGLLGLIEVVHLVPPGAALKVAKFYTQALAAPVSPHEPSGWAVHFTAGASLRQTLVFQDDEDFYKSKGEDLTKADVLKDANGGNEDDAVCELCLYLPSHQKFADALSQCTGMGIISGQRPFEFRFRKVMDPTTQELALELEHIIRSPDHPCCPKAVKEARATYDEATSGPNRSSTEEMPVGRTEFTDFTRRFA